MKQKKENEKKKKKKQHQGTEAENYDPFSKKQHLSPAPPPASSHAIGAHGQFRVYLVA